MTTARSTLRQLLAGPPFLAADCYSALSARIVEQVGFAAAYLGGHATGMMHYAIPDCGLLTTTEMLEQAGRVASRVTIPLIVDADQGGETVADVHRTVAAFERAGVAGIHLEDEVNPKHSRWDGPLAPIADMQARLAAAAAARTDPDFVLIARCDELYAEGGGGGGSVEETIARGRAYAEAGADVFLPTFASAEQLAAIAPAVPLPLAGYGRLLPGLTLSLFTGWGTASAARTHAELARRLLADGDLDPELYQLPDKDLLIDQGLYDDLVATWATSTGRPVTGS